MKKLIKKLARRFFAKQITTYAQRVVISKEMKKAFGDRQEETIRMTIARGLVNELISRGGIEFISEYDERIGMTSLTGKIRVI